MSESTEIAHFQQARLPFHPAIEERYQIDKGSWKVLTEAIFPAAQSIDSVIMALAYCKSRNLDVMKRPVHIVPVWDSKKGGMVETVWPSISELRTTAFRTGNYAGCDEAEFGPTITKKFSGDVKVSKRGQSTWETREIEHSFPEWCRITVYRMLAGQKCKFVGPKVLWLESYATQGKSELPNTMWLERTEGQLEKCAEAAALRKAFPEELGNELTADEMAGRRIDSGEPIIPSDDGPPPATKSPPPPVGGPQSVPPPKATTAPPKPEKPTSEPPKAKEPETAVQPPIDEPIDADFMDLSDEPPQMEDEPEPQKEAGPAPHEISGAGKSGAQWAAEYLGLFAQSTTTHGAWAWIDANRRKLDKLAQAFPADMATLKAGQEDHFKRLAATKAQVEPPPLATEPPKPHRGRPAGSKNKPKEPEAPPADADPERLFGFAESILGACETGEQVQEAWQSRIEPKLIGLFPPDVDGLQGILRKHEVRVEK